MRAIFTPVLAGLVLTSALLAGHAAQTVSLAGLLGTKALVIVDGGAPKALAAGETHQNVKVLAVQSDRVVVEANGAKQTLRLGDVPVSVGNTGGAPASGGRIVLPVGSGGHFSALGSINGRPANMMVDTGATSVAIGKSDADRIGLDYKNAKQVRMMTANGASTGWVIKLGVLRVGDVDIYDVEAVVVPSAMPYVLLGNSYLARFQMNRNNDQLVLVKRF
jgi:aspartyl protease family protein